MRASQSDIQNSQTKHRNNEWLGIFLRFTPKCNFIPVAERDSILQLLEKRPLGVRSLNIAPFKRFVFGLGRYLVVASPLHKHSNVKEIWRKMGIHYLLQSVLTQTGICAKTIE